MSYTTQVSYLERQISEAQKKLEILRRLPTEDTFAEGTCIRFVVERKTDRRQLSYLLLKVVHRSNRLSHYDETTPTKETRWYFTGSLVQLGGSRRTANERRWVSWSELLAWLVDDVDFVMWDMLVEPSKQVPMQITIDLMDDSPAGRYTLTRGQDDIYR